MVIAFVIWSIVAAVFLAIGISEWKSKEAVGFFTFVKPPEVTDVRGYNHSVAVLWMAAAVIMELMGAPFLFLEQNSPAYMIVVIGMLLLVIGMMIAYTQIEAKYKKK